MRMGDEVHFISLDPLQAELEEGFLVSTSACLHITGITRGF